MLIVQIEPPHNTKGGDWFYRTHAPGRALAAEDDVFVIDLTNVHRRRDALFETAYVIVLNMVCDPDLLPLVKARSERGQVTVYEVNDDVAHVQPSNPVAGFFANPHHQILFRRLVHAAFAAQFSTQELIRIYGFLNPKQALFRNQLSRPAAPRPERTDSRTVIGWGGSAGHLEDIARIAEPLKAFVNERADVVLHIMGSERIGALFAGLPADKLRLFSPGSLDHYYAFVAGLDIGIAPLEDAGFNRSRSDVKFLEYGLHGVAPVVKALAPYADTVVHGETGFLFEHTPLLISTLQKLVETPELRARVAENARRYVTEQRSERAHARERLDFYRSLGAGDSAKTAIARAEPYTRLAGAELSGRHLSLQATDYENLLHDALVLSQLEGKRSEALALLRRARALEPSLYQPYLFASAVSDEPLAELSTCLAKNPRSLAGRVALARALERAGRPGDAVRELLLAAEIHPAYDLPYFQLAQILQRAGQGREAHEFHAMAERLRAPLERRAA
jgi:glycosyltransferase involved in cell wall biosynthesis